MGEGKSRGCRASWGNYSDCSWSFVNHSDSGLEGNGHLREGQVDARFKGKHSEEDVQRQKSRVTKSLWKSAEEVRIKRPQRAGWS